MRPPIPISELKILGGNLALDFVNTVGAWTNGLERDSFQSSRDVLDWAKRLGIIDGSQARGFAKALEEPEVGNRFVREARKLRLVVRDVFSAIAGGKAPPAEPFELLASCAARAQSRRKLVSTRDGVRWEWTSDETPMTILDRVAHAAAELAIQAQGLRIKECPGHACGWLFIDTSRNGKRRWCSEADCGVRERVRAHRERKAEEG